MFSKILAAYDGSDHAKTALGIACDMAKKYNAELHLASVPQIVGDMMMVGYSAVPMPPSPAEVEKAKEDTKADAVAIAKGHGFSDCAIHMGDGDPAHVIVETARENGCDLIIMGRRGLGQFTGLLVGSTTNKVSQMADCAVLTVK